MAWRLREKKDRQENLRELASLKGARSLRYLDPRFLAWESTFDISSTGQAGCAWAVDRAGQ